MKQKTINYLHGAANTANELLAKAIEYRSKYDGAKTQVAKDLYKKKLTKTINKLEPFMKMFSGLQQAKAAAEQNTEQQPDTTEAIEESKE